LRQRAIPCILSVRVSPYVLATPQSARFTRSCSEAFLFPPASIPDSPCIGKCNIAHNSASSNKPILVWPPSCSLIAGTTAGKSILYSYALGLYRKSHIRWLCLFIHLGFSIWPHCRRKLCHTLYIDITNALQYVGAPVKSESLQSSSLTVRYLLSF
jgi:hypothetical protein